MDPMFVVRCWNRTRGHILARAAVVTNSDRGGKGVAVSFEFCIGIRMQNPD